MAEEGAPLRSNSVPVVCTDGVGGGNDPPLSCRLRDLAARFDGDSTVSGLTNGTFLLLSGMSWIFEAAFHSHSTSHLLCRSRGVALRLSTA